jgi:hypothetical protein
MVLIKFTNYIDPNSFFISLAVGLLFFYVIAPQKRIVIKYPNPENAGKVVYKDTNENCFKFKAKEVTCPKNKSDIKDVTDND